ncbi:MAG: hypothetical protein HN995_02680 [Candidatus Marinimicrobia bacterium]|jgi:hypothetical protein|nr:hypothetical protein [Candidatus Neomarinimicrobiota bacterium]MBT3576471.1 hypothetical protein [Candidatus Neomarinimicrobiota bacterium]MBT3949573.1 hypothetical protein [Candidatus Neomarinimicrobiota bacterium]MBT4251910.1 hypothetical protein [Candidatus Neomarinimicrobiota bacterium]MBT4481710.1 hypothetical protein [Candidatus Neomarinimicrobiota bacterium]
MTDDFMDSPEFQALIKEYLNYLNTALPGVRGHLSDNLYKDVYKFGHNIKGTGTSYGFENLSELGAEICNNIKAENYSNLGSLLDNVGNILTEALA